MIVAVLLSEDREFIGRFEFRIIPRIGEVIHVPWPVDVEGQRIFSIDEIWHYANGSPLPESVLSSDLALLVSEIT